jgi:hypothetical protein
MRSAPESAFSRLQSGSAHHSLALLFAIAAVVGAGCQPCNRTGMSISADAKETTLTAPPGGGARSFVEIYGRSFAPNAQITLSFQDIPSSDPARTGSTASVTTDGGGGFYWTGDISAFGPLDYSSDPTADVHITAKETNSGCFALTSIKAGSLLHPPLH